MPYFVILWAFLAAFVAESVALGLCAVVPALRRALPYGWRMLVGSGLGFLAANFVSILVGVVPVLIAAVLRVDKEGHVAQIVAAFALLGLFVGPLIVSPIGFLGGAWLGLRRALRAEGVAEPVPARR